MAPNDGSDVRINKEIKSLSKEFNIYYLGISQDENSSPFIADYVVDSYVIRGKRKSLSTITKLYYYFLFIICSKKISSVHVVNEEFGVIFSPFLCFFYTVLDVFDSNFLKKNIPANKWKFIKWLLYKPSNKVIVTDKNRYDYYPSFIKSKSVIIENYPNKLNYTYKNYIDTETLKIAYVGSLSKVRGSLIVKNILDNSSKVSFLFAGWIYDEYTNLLINNNKDRIEYVGVVKQNEVNRLINEKCDYILCVYEPSNDNNINASPNKVYDAIQTLTPVIINSEVKISNFVEKNQLGYVIPNFNNINYDVLINELVKNKYIINENLAAKFCWENQEDTLISLHKTK